MRFALMALVSVLSTRARADVTDSGSLVLGQQAIVQGTMTVQGNAFSVGGATLAVQGGTVSLGGKVLATAGSTLTVQGSANFEVWLASGDSASLSRLIVYTTNYPQVELGGSSQTFRVDLRFKVTGTNPTPFLIVNGDTGQKYGYSVAYCHTGGCIGVGSADYNAFCVPLVQDQSGAYNLNNGAFVTSTVRWDTKADTRVVTWFEIRTEADMPQFATIEVPFFGGGKYNGTASPARIDFGVKDAASCNASQNFTDSFTELHWDLYAGMPHP